MGEWRYPQALRDELVRLVDEGHRPEDLADRYGPTAGTIRYWVRAARQGRIIGDPAPLTETHPEVAAQVDPGRNPGVDAARLSAGSRRRIWWRCPQGHLWQATISGRTQGAGCPSCAGRHQAGITVTHPHLAAEVDPDQNQGLDLARLTAGSHRRLWWRCPEGHRWQAPVYQRAAGRGCPQCARAIQPERSRRAWQARPVERSLADADRALAGEIDPVRNPGADPDRIWAGSTRTLWWRCPHGHRWKATVAARTRGTGCPVCAGQHPAPLTETHPRLAAELHPTRNQGVSAAQVHAGAHGLLWWRCDAGHEWEATPAARALGAACPHCTGPSDTEVVAGRRGRRLCAWTFPEGHPRAGQRCRGAAVAGSDFCTAHQPTTVERCTALTKTGGRCARPAQPGSDRCALHDHTAEPARTTAPPEPPTRPPAGRRDRMACPGCGRKVATRPGVTDDGAPLAVLYPHRDRTGRDCPTRIVPLSH